jgi:hypothetical protein
MSLLDEMELMRLCVEGKTAGWRTLRNWRTGTSDSTWDS